jgi:hypothetical protein
MRAIMNRSHHRPAEDWRFRNSNTRCRVDLLALALAAAAVDVVEPNSGVDSSDAMVLLFVTNLYA